MPPSGVCAGRTAIRNPDERLAAALRPLFAWDRETEDMTGNALRDAPIVPALDKVMNDKFWPLVKATAAALAAGRACGAPAAGGSRRLCSSRSTLEPA